VKFSSSLADCIQATGGTLKLDAVVVDSCAGGGIHLDGAAFDIENTTVTNSGPGMVGATSWGGVLISVLPTSGITLLKLDTIQGNKGPGVACTGQISGAGIYATGNSTSDVGTSCGFTTCSPTGPTCGAP
jgi:hypothetical protein